VFVSNIGDATVRELEALFSTCGNIISSKVSYGKDEEPLGYGYILFEDEAAAERAIETRHGFVFRGTALAVEQFKGRGERQT
jgi:polyadenylate-binding protein